MYTYIHNIHRCVYIHKRLYASVDIILSMEVTKYIYIAL